MLFGRKKRNPLKILDKKVVEWKYTTCGYCSTDCYEDFEQRSACWHSAPTFPTIMPGAFFWKNKSFEEHARKTGLAKIPQVGIVEFDR